MSGSSDHFRQTDVMFWGMVALALGAFAVLGANVSTFLPANVMTAFHSTRLDGGNLNHLRTQVAELRDEAARIRTENSRLQTMLSISEQDQGAVARRIGAIEDTLPVLLEGGTGNTVDSAFLTSAIGDDTRETVAAEGGSVEIIRRPLTSATENSSTANLAVPEMPPIPAAPTRRVIETVPSSFGVALGPQVTVRDAFLAWKDITTKSGPLLLGLGPLLSGNAGVEQQRLVAGPIAGYSQAEEICARMIRIGISCLPVPYAGQALPQ